MSDMNELIISVRELTDTVSRKVQDIDNSILTMNQAVEVAINEMNEASSSLRDFNLLGNASSLIAMGVLNVITNRHNRVLPVGNDGNCFSLKVHESIDVSENALMIDAPQGEFISIGGERFDSVRINSSREVLNFYRINGGWSL